MNRPHPPTVEHGAAHPSGSAVALVSAKGSPGVTTSAVLLAAVWPGGATLLEADPAGGDLRMLFTDSSGQPLRPDRGVVSLLTANPAAPATVRLSPSPESFPPPFPPIAAPLEAHDQQIPGGLPVVLGPSNASQVEALRPLWPQLATVITSQIHACENVIVDAGRVGDPSSLALTLPLLRTCATTLVVTRASVASLAHTRDLLTLLWDVTVPAGLLLIGDPRDRNDVAQALQLPLEQTHVLPHDPESAATVTGPWTRRLDRSHLLHAARTTASTLAGTLGPPTTARPSRAASGSESGSVPVPDLTHDLAHDLTGDLVRDSTGAAVLGAVRS